MDPTSGDQLTAASKGAASKSIDDILNTLGAKNQQNKLEEQQAAFELASADFSDVICAACELGGDMICCDGHCLRSFHPKCIDLNEEDIPEDAPFLCVDCSNGIHRCFVCKHFELESELVKCSLPFCGKFYHKKCMGNVKPGKPVCARHTCNECKNTSTTPFNSTKVSWWRCFRCPLAFDSCHRPRDVHIISEGIFLCIRHIQEGEVLPEPNEDLFRRIAAKERMWSDVLKSKSEGQSSYDEKEKAIRDRTLKERRQMLDRASRMQDLMRKKAAAETGDAGDTSTSDIAIKKKRSHTETTSTALSLDGDDSDDDDVGRGGTKNKSLKRQVVLGGIDSRLIARNRNRQTNAAAWHVASSPSSLNGEDNYRPQGSAYQVSYQTYTVPAAPVGYYAGNCASPAYPEVPYSQSYGGHLDSDYPSNGYGMYSYRITQPGSYGSEYEPPYPPYGATIVSDSMYPQMYNNAVPAQSSHTYSQPHYQQYPPQNLNTHLFYGVRGPREPIDHVGFGVATSQRKMDPQELVARLKASGHMS